MDGKEYQIQLGTGHTERSIEGWHRRLNNCKINMEKEGKNQYELKIIIVRGIQCVRGVEGAEVPARSWVHLLFSSSMVDPVPAAIL